MIHYFSLNESETNSHVGTVLTNSLSNKEFTEKVKLALETHFDTEINICELDIYNYISGQSGILIVDIDGCEYKVYICETFVY